VPQRDHSISSAGFPARAADGWPRSPYRRIAVSPHRPRHRPPLDRHRVRALRLRMRPPDGRRAVRRMRAAGSASPDSAARPEPQPGATCVPRSGGMATAASVKDGLLDEPGAPGLL